MAESEDQSENQNEARPDSLDPKARLKAYFPASEPDDFSQTGQSRNTAASSPATSPQPNAPLQPPNLGPSQAGKPADQTSASLLDRVSKLRAQMRESYRQPEQDSPATQPPQATPASPQLAQQAPSQPTFPQQRQPSAAPSSAQPGPVHNALPNASTPQAPPRPPLPAAPAQQPPFPYAQGSQQLAAQQPPLPGTPFQQVPPRQDQFPNSPAQPTASQQQLESSALKQPIPPGRGAPSQFAAPGFGLDLAPSEQDDSAEGDGDSFESSGHIRSARPHSLNTIHAPSTESSKTLLIVVTLFVVLIGAGIGVFFFLSQNPKPTEQPAVTAAVSIEQLVSAADSAFQQGKYAEAITQLDNAIKMDSKRADVFERRGNAQAKLEDYAKAAADFTDALALNPSSIRDRINRAFAYYQSERYEEAAQDYSSVLSADSKYADAYFGRALCLRQLGKQEQAGDDLKRVLELKPTYYQAEVELGNIDFSAKKYARALGAYNKAINNEPSSAAAYFCRASAHFRMGNIGKALSDYDKAVQLCPSDPDYLNDRGFACYQLKRKSEAIASFKKALELDPNHTLAKENLAAAEQK